MLKEQKELQKELQKESKSEKELLLELLQGCEKAEEILTRVAEMGAAALKLAVQSPVESAERAERPQRLSAWHRVSRCSWAMSAVRGSTR